MSFLRFDRYLSFSGGMVYLYPLSFPYWSIDVFLTNSSELLDCKDINPESVLGQIFPTALSLLFYSGYSCFLPKGTLSGPRGQPWALTAQPAQLAPLRSKNMIKY